MKQTLIAASMALVMASGTSLAADYDQRQAFSYTMGFEMAEKLRERGLDVDPAAFAKGIEQSLNGTKPDLSAEQRQASVKAQQELELAKFEDKLKANEKAGADYRERNKQRDGVTEIAGGVQYEVIKAGSGKSPKATDKVEVHYHGTTITGTVFDSSVERGTTTTFPVNGVVPGFREALVRMKEGDKWRVVIPPKLAYGERGAGDVIGPNETLIFELELIKVL